MTHTLTLSRLIALIVIALLVGTPAVPDAAVAASALSPMATSPSLGDADSYSVLGGSIVTNTGLSTVEGNLGISPGIGTMPHYSGFPPGIVGPPGAIHDVDTSASLAQAANTAAFGALSAGANAACNFTYGPAQDLAGMTLAPGVHCFPTSAQITTGVALTLDAATNADAVWIFRIASTLITTPGVGATVQIINGGSACEVWWQVGSSAALGGGTHFLGNIMALTSISLGTGASLDGRALAQTGAVTLDNNSITYPICIPAAVELLHFGADSLNEQQVLLQWTTALELDNFGFNLYRAGVNDFAQAELIRFEPASAQGGSSGGTYAYLDTLPHNGTWWYWLADVDTQGRETLHAPINTAEQALINQTYRIYLPLIKEAH